MSETPRCEPADPTKEQWGWLRTPTHGPVLCKWYEHNGVAGAWCWHYGGSRDGDINPAFISELGWTYVSAVPTPAEIAALVAAAQEAEEVMALTERVPFCDPQHGDEIKALGDRIGYGALMTSASRSWHDAIERQGYAGGQFVAGPCHATVMATLKLLRAALAAFPAKETKDDT